MSLPGRVRFESIQNPRTEAGKIGGHRIDVLGARIRAELTVVVASLRQVDAGVLQEINDSLGSSLVGDAVRLSRQLFQPIAWNAEHKAVPVLRNTDKQHIAPNDRCR